MEGIFPKNGLPFTSTPSFLTHLAENSESTPCSMSAWCLLLCSHFGAIQEMTRYCTH